MKHLIKISLLLLVLLFPSFALAYSFEADGIFYNINGDQVTVTYKTSSYNSYSGDIIIPETVTYDDVTYQVTAIGYNAFYGCTDLTSVTLPNSMKDIGSGAFTACRALTSVNIPNSVTNIDNGAFNECSALTSIVIPSSVTSIGSSAFLSCSGLTSIVVESDNQYYDSRDNCNALIETATNTLITGCQNSTIPNTVTTIAFWAFLNCSGLTSIEIPSSVTGISQQAFSSCKGLTTMRVSDDNQYYDSRDNCNAIIETASNTVIAGCKNTIIPNTVTTIGTNAFSGCSEMTSIVIPNSVTTIGYEAFHSCHGLKSINIPNSVSTIDGFAFINCYGATSATVGTGVTSIGRSAFAGCTALDTLYYNAVHCNDFSSTANNRPFTNLNISTIIFGDSVQRIPAYFVNGVKRLTNVTIPPSVTSIGRYAFSGTPWYNNQPNGVIYIGSFVYGYKGTMPAGTSITLRDGTIGINDYAFSQFANLSSVSIPSSLKYSGNGGFAFCTGLTSVHISDIAAWCQIDFYDLSSNPVFNAHHLYLDGEEVTELVLPDSVTSIGNYAFARCTGLTSANIPNSVTSIGSAAFRGCTELTSVTMPNDITVINSETFYDCTGLTSVSIPNSVVEIGNMAFSYCI